LQGTSNHHIQTDSSEPEKMQKKGSSVGLRWLTALILMPVAVLIAWFGGWVAFAVVLLAVVVGILELNAMFVHAGYHPTVWVSFLVCALFLIAAMFPEQRTIITDVGLSAGLFLSVICLFFRKSLEGALIDWALTLAMPVYLGWSASFFLLLRGSEVGILHPASGAWLYVPSGVWWLLVALLGVWGFDSAAFFAGRYFGRHKLIPMISPAKTWEGVIGGLVFSVIAALLITVVPLHVPWYLAVVLGIVIGIAATIGDLAESVIKRQTGVKDSGQVLPGHGGVLDRIDSLLFVVIVVYLFAQLFPK
jgi:phosphatidate cytidylyltransferase